MTETWAEKAERLALELKDAVHDPFIASKKMRARYAQAHYAMWLHIRDVGE